MSKKTIIILVTIIGIIGLIAVISNQAQNSNQNNAQAQPVNQLAVTKTTLNTVQELQARLTQNNPNDVLLDVRTPEEFGAGHLKNAINVDYESPNFTSEIAKLDKSKTYIVFCRSGNRAIGASDMMLKQGFKNIVYSNEGITAWESAGFQTIK